MFELDIYGAIDRIKYMSPDIILLGHSHDSFIGGVSGGQKMQADLTAYAGLPVTVPSMAYLAAIKALKIEDVAVLTPYLSADDGLVHAFFTDAGCRVRRIKSLQYDTAYDIAATPTAVVLDCIKELDGTDIEAILQVGTNLPAARLCAVAESWLGKPVLSVNVVTYWFALRQLGISDVRSDLGVLFADQ